MTEKTIQEIKAEHGAREAEILTADYDAQQETRELRKPEEGIYLDRLTPEQRMSLLREQKAQREEERYSQTTEALTAENSRYQAELAERAGFLKERLFAVQDANTVASLPSATEEQLGELLDLAILTGNKDAARAAFVGAHMRSLGDLMARYFAEVDPEARALYQEWTQIPPEDLLRRQRENISTVVQRPNADRLMPPARVNV